MQVSFVARGDRVETPADPRSMVAIQSKRVWGTHNGTRWSEGYIQRSESESSSRNVRLFLRAMSRRSRRSRYCPSCSRAADYKLRPALAQDTIPTCHLSLLGDPVSDGCTLKPVSQYPAAKSNGRRGSKG